MINLLRRAWDTLDTFKQTYPENWHEEDQQVLDDLIMADLRLQGVEVKWVGLTDEEIKKLRHLIDWTNAHTYNDFARAIEAKLKEKNSETNK